MNNETRFFDITPRVIRADAETTVTIRPRFGHVAFAEGAALRAVVYPGEHYVPRSGDAQAARLERRGDAVAVTHTFAGEQEHILEVLDSSGEEETVALRVLLYSVAGDLFARTPFKGDVHMHSHHSDGKESPAFVAASCRRIGLDFMALTDHGQYAPSIESQAAFEEVDTDLLICRGEEVHPPDNPVHMINFGGRFSVNESFNRDRAAYDEAVTQREAELPAGLDDHTRHQVASCEWVFDRVRAGGGLGVFCHPYWHVRHGYTPSAATTAALFERQPFDAYELLGGYAKYQVDSNTLQVARYHEERIRGRQLPIVGVSDAHGCHNSDLFGWYYTIVFAPELSQESLHDGIKSLYSVAVEAMPGESVRVYGPLRLVQYALFLLHELFPAHDELCVVEGDLMLRHAGGDGAAAARLDALQGSCARWWRACRGD